MRCGGWVGRDARYGVGEYFCDKVYEYWTAKAQQAVDSSLAHVQSGVDIGTMRLQGRQDAPAT